MCFIWAARGKVTMFECMGGQFLSDKGGRNKAARFSAVAVPTYQYLSIWAARLRRIGGGKLVMSEYAGGQVATNRRVTKRVT